MASNTSAATAAAAASAATSNGVSAPTPASSSQAELCRRAVASIRRITRKKATIAIVCGSGLGGIGEHIKEGTTIAYVLLCTACLLKGLSHHSTGAELSAAHVEITYTQPIHDATLEETEPPEKH